MQNVELKQVRSKPRNQDDRKTLEQAIECIVVLKGWEFKEYQKQKMICIISEHPSAACYESTEQNYI